MNIVIFSFSVKLLKEAEKIENLLVKISKIDEEDEHSPNEFYCPEYLQTLDAETRTSSAFYHQKPSPI